MDLSPGGQGPRGRCARRPKSEVDVVWKSATIRSVGEDVRRVFMQRRSSSAFSKADDQCTVQKLE